MSDIEEESIWVIPYRTPKVTDHYTIRHVLGRGYFGTTYLCIDKTDGKKFACKSIFKYPFGEDNYDSECVLREIQVMHHLSELPNVVRIEGVYEDELYVHLVMELCNGGELFERINDRKHYPEREAAKLIRTIVGVVEACQSLRVIHRDLKPENFLFVGSEKNAALKAIDFGLSVFYGPDETFSDEVGTDLYVAPEVLSKCHGPEADVWSAGVILYALLTGKTPFGEITEDNLREVPISGSAKDLISKMLNRDVSKRLTAHQVLCHPWIVDDGLAPDKPLDSAILSRLKRFSAMNKLKKIALLVIAERLLEEEIYGLKKLFKMIDTDNSDTITFDELKDGLRRLDCDLMDWEVQALMDAADINQNGTIDYPEFLAATLHMNKWGKKENLRTAFNFFDKDRNGYITIDDLSQACQELFIDGVHPDKMITEIDQNNDGKIDYDEFAAMMREGTGGN